MPFPRFSSPLLWLPLLLLLTSAFVVGDKIKLKKVSITKNLTVGIPDNFAPVPDAGIAAKYPAARKPLAVYSNPAGRVDFSVASKETTFTNLDYGLLIKLYESNLKRTYTKVDFIAKDIRTINKRDFIVLEFVSTLADNRRGREMMAPIKRYEFMQYAIEGNQLYVFHFVSPTEEQPTYQPVAQEVMQSIVMK